MWYLEESLEFQMGTLCPAIGRPAVQTFIGIPWWSLRRFYVNLFFKNRTVQACMNEAGIAH